MADDNGGMNATDVVSSMNSINLNTRSGGFTKTTSNIDFSTRLKRGVAQGASLTYQSVAPIAPFVPGGAVMSAMLNNTAATLSGDGIGLGSMSGGVGVGSIPGLMGSGGGGIGMPGMMPGTGLAGGVPGAENGGMFQSMEHLQQNMMSMNVYMLGLQQGFNEMNQKYTAVSNILKTKHDTEKNAIQNFR